MKPGFWVPCLLAVITIWVLAIPVKEWAARQKATADNIQRLIEQQPLEQTQGPARQRYLENLAEQINRLSFEERRALALRRTLDPVVDAMTPEERTFFLDRTVPQGFAQIMEVFNRMSPEERRAAVERALDDLYLAEKEAGMQGMERARARWEDGSLQRVVEQGFEAYLRHASAETKLDLAPVIEQIQQNVRRLQRD